MLEPLIVGDCPYVMKRTVGSRLPVFTEEESELVKGSADFLGIIYYLAATVTKNNFFSDMGVSVTFLGNVSCFEYDVIPWAMEGFLQYMKERYGNPPVYILENGKPMKRDLQREVMDAPRIDLLDAYIGAVFNAVRNGSDTRGYFVWSFMDLFGMYYVNFSDPHLKRTPQLSALRYSAFLKGNNNKKFATTTTSFLIPMASHKYIATSSSSSSAL